MAFGVRAQIPRQGQTFTVGHAGKPVRIPEEEVLSAEIVGMCQEPKGICPIHLAVNARAPAGVGHSCSSAQKPEDDARKVLRIVHRDLASIRHVHLGQRPHRPDATGRLAKKARASSGKRNKAQAKSRDELREVEVVDEETGRTSIEYRRRS